MFTYIFPGLIKNSKDFQHGSGKQSLNTTGESEKTVGSSLGRLAPVEQGK